MPKTPARDDYFTQSFRFTLRHLLSLRLQNLLEAKVRAGKTGKR